MFFAPHSKSVAANGPRNALGYREVLADGTPSPYKWYTYAEVGKKVEQLGAALVKVGLARHGRCGVFGANSAEWMLALQACNRQTVYCVPLYDTLGENAIEYIINHSESTVAFTAALKLPTLVAALPKCPNLKTVVVWGKVDAAKLDEARSKVRVKGARRCRNIIQYLYEVWVGCQVPLHCKFPYTVPSSSVPQGVTVYTFDEFVQLGAFNPAPADPPTKDDLCTIMYTSVR